MARLRRDRYHFAWRTAVLAGVIMCAVVAMLLGTGFSERPPINEVTVVQKMYYTLGLFVFGGLDLGTPVGGSVLGQALMWFALFAAPAITAASVIEGVLRAVAPVRWHLRRIRGHVVVVGCGRIGRLWLSRFRHMCPDVPVVMVDLKPDHPAQDEVREVHRAHYVSGDIRDPAMLKSLRLDKAQSVLLFSGDDFANLDVAADIKDYPNLRGRLFVRVAEQELYRHAKEIESPYHVVNELELAAKELVNKQLIPHFDSTKPLDTVILAGFGRFGQTVLKLLNEQRPHEIGQVVIIDKQAKKQMALFRQSTELKKSLERTDPSDASTHRLHIKDDDVLDEDLRDPAVWEEVAKKVPGLGDKEAVVILGSGDDEANLITGLTLSNAGGLPKATVMARSFYRSKFVSDRARELDVKLRNFSLSELIDQGMGEILSKLEERTPKKTSKGSSSVG